MEDKRLYLVRAHLDGKVPIPELVQSHGVHRTTIKRWVDRFVSGGPDALVERSRRPRSSPSRTSSRVEDEIVRLRKILDETGLDAGAESIHARLAKTVDEVPSVTTIWRILRRRGFVDPQPKKRPRSSYTSFEAELPNEMWQSDMTHWSLSDDTGVEIVSYLDDCSRKALRSKAVLIAKATTVVEIFHEAGQKWGYPASLLTDNGCIYTAKYRNGRVGLETELETMGIVFKHGRPYHPQTQGKVERFQQTMKKWLSKQPKPATLEELQTQLDAFCSIYNSERPHRSLNRRTPDEVWNERVKAQPGDPIDSTHYRTRIDRVDKTGSVTLRYRSRLHHIGVGRPHKGKEIMLLIHDKDIRIIDVNNGDELRHFTLDPTKDYQRQERTK